MGTYRRQNILFATRSAQVAAELHVQYLLVAEKLFLEDVLLDGIPQAFGSAVFHVARSSLSVFLVELLD